MKKFKFRLQKVLEFRENLKRGAEIVLMQKNATLFDAEEKLQAILEEQDRTPPPRDEIMTMAEFSLTGNYQAFLREALMYQRECVEQAKAAVEAAREVYVEKAKDVKSLDVLKDKRHEAFKEEKKREEKKQQDRLVVMRHGTQKHF